MALELKDFVLSTICNDPVTSRYSYCFSSKKQNKNFACSQWFIYVQLKSITAQNGFAGCFEGIHGKIIEFEFNSQNQKLELHTSPLSIKFTRFILTLCQVSKVKIIC